MITAVDTNILLDLLIPGEPHLASSKGLLERHLTKGSLVLCETVFAELAARFAAEDVLKEFLAETGIRFIPSSQPALHIAGTRWAEFSRKNRRDRFSCGACGNLFEVSCPRCGRTLTRRQLVIGDFLIGAHALVHADCLLSRDRGVYARWFRDLRLVDSL